MTGLDKLVMRRLRSRVLSNKIRKKLCNALDYCSCLVTSRSAQILPGTVNWSLHLRSYLSRAGKFEER